MATFLDVTGLQAFTNIFAFLFTWIIVYALLMYSKVLGGNTVLQILISLIVGIFVLLSEIATNMILVVAPWFAVLFVFAILVSVAFGSFGASTNTPTFMGLKTAILVFFVVVMALLALGEISGGSSIATVGGDEESEGPGLSIITEPRIFGVIIIALISVFTIALLTIKS
ncbi:hypothetical protein ACFLZX_03575 [Nanoarchaeota archaeon]